jgi:hypothetical protein
MVSGNTSAMLEARELAVIRLAITAFCPRDRLPLAATREREHSRPAKLEANSCGASLVGLQRIAGLGHQFAPAVPKVGIKQGSSD